METDGKDDAKYMALMSRYKELRSELGPKADPYLRAASMLLEKGDVSQDAVMGAAYL